MNSSCNQMKPVDVGSVTLIPTGNNDPNISGSFANMQREYMKGSYFTSHSSLHPDFKPSVDGLEGPWQAWKSGI